MGQGYAQVFEGTAPDLSQIIELQKKAADMEAAKQKKAQDKKDEVQKDIAKTMAKLPTDLYSGHNPEFNKRLDDLLKYTYENIDKLEPGSPEGVEFERKKNSITLFANQSKNFREKYETLVKNNANLSEESQAYLEQIKTGYSPDGQPILDIDPNMMYMRPNLSKALNAPEVMRILKGEENAETKISPYGNDMFETEVTTTRKLTPEKIKEAQELAWGLLEGPQQESSLRTVMYGIENNNPKYQKYAALVQEIQQPDGTMVKDYTEATKQWALDHLPVKPFTETKIKSHLTNKAGQRVSRGGAGDLDVYDSEIDVSEDMFPTAMYTDDGKPTEFDWYDSTFNGNPRAILRNRKNNQFYTYVKDSSTGQVTTTPITEEEMNSSYSNVTPRPTKIERRVETVSAGKEKSIGFTPTFVIDKNGKVKTTGFEQGIKLVPKEFFYKKFNKRTNSFDVRGEEKDSELMYFMKGIDKNGNIYTIPMDEPAINTLEKGTSTKDYDGFIPKTWREYKRLKGSQKKSATKTTQPAGQGEKKVKKKASQYGL